MAPGGCIHDEVEFLVEMICPDDGAFRYATLKARCTDCRQQFHFRGIASGQPNPDEPTVSADAYELRTPIVAGPGAIVGLLERTGLSDALKVGQ